MIVAEQDDLGRPCRGLRQPTVFQECSNGPDEPGRRRGVGITGALPVPERGRGHEMTARVTVCGPAWRA
jgi:hypothetical protein